MTYLRCRLHHPMTRRSMVMTLLFAALFQAIANADDIRFVVAVEAPLTASDGTLLGHLGLGTRVKVLAETQDAFEVVVEGWSMEAGPSAVFFNDSQRILLIALTEEGQSETEVLDTTTDSFATVWNQVHVKGLLDAADLNQDLSETWEAGDVLLQERCGGCHAVPRPDQYTANQWPGTISSMVPSYAVLTDEELELLRKYVQFHASDM